MIGAAFSLTAGGASGSERIARRRVRRALPANMEPTPKRGR